MSREIKFRIWDKEKKEMIPYTRVTSIQFWTDRVNIFARGCLFFKDIELMQYTGFKDKNGKEIYEGDIVELHDEDDFFKVEYQANCAKFILTTNTIDTDFDYYSQGNINQFYYCCSACLAFFFASISASASFLDRLILP